VDPLEQFFIAVFENHPWASNCPVTNLRAVLYWSFSCGLSSITKMLVFNVLLVILWIYSLRTVLILNKFQKLILFTFLFISNILTDSIAIKKYSFVLLIYTTFLFLFISNILGMIPYTMTITSHLIITLYFSLAFFIGSNIIGICYLKQSFFVLFLPEGVPLLIIPFLILIEYISYISRIFSLAIRLFANMLSGHILLKILISFVWAMVSSNPVHWLWNVLPMLIIFFVIGLEFSIAFLQGYVFIVLINIYLKDLIHTH
jgi:ATP synthase subunit 6